MKTISELTDRELNEWVVNNITGWMIAEGAHESLTGGSWFKDKWLDAWPDTNNRAPDFCNNLNHTRLMEEKIREMGKEDQHYLRLFCIVNKQDWGGEIDFNTLTALRTAYATARQRCEAAYLTFNKESK